jgi:hypothetical protein
VLPLLQPPSFAASARHVKRMIGRHGARLGLTGVSSSAACTSRSVAKVIKCEKQSKRMFKPPCRDYLTAEGCKFGTRCRFSHGEAAAAAPAPAAAPAAAKAFCRDYLTAEGCKFGTRCRFSHGAAAAAAPGRKGAGGGREDAARGRGYAGGGREDPYLSPAPAFTGHGVLLPPLPYAPAGTDPTMFEPTKPAQVPHPLRCTMPSPITCALSFTVRSISRVMPLFISLAVHCHRAHPCAPESGRMLQHPCQPCSFHCIILNIKPASSKYNRCFER